MKSEYTPINPNRTPASASSPQPVQKSLTARAIAAFAVLLALIVLASRAPFQPIHGTSHFPLRLSAVKYPVSLQRHPRTVVLPVSVRGSWDSYIDNLIAHTKDSSGIPSCDKACIIGMDGAAWTTNSDGKGIVLSPGERDAISAAFSRGDFTTFMMHGISVEGVSYAFLRYDGIAVYGKKKGHGAITMQKSRTGIVIGHTIEGKSQGNTNKGVAVIAEYLESLSV